MGRRVVSNGARRFARRRTADHACLPRARRATPDATRGSAGRAPMRLTFDPMVPCAGPPGSGPHDGDGAGCGARDRPSTQDTRASVGCVRRSDAGRRREGAGYHGPQRIVNARPARRSIDRSEPRKVNRRFFPARFPARSPNDLHSAKTLMIKEKTDQPACKPGSVGPAEVSRPRRTWRPFLWDGRRRPPRATNPGDWPGERACPFSIERRRAAPIRSCSRWGLPCRPRCRVRGALLPHPFTLTPRGPSRTRRRAVCSLWHCPWGRPRRRLSGTVSPWSPDFPPRTACAIRSGRPAG